VSDRFPPTGGRSPSTGLPSPLFASARTRGGEKAIGWGLRGAAGISILITIAIVLSLATEAARFLTTIQLSQLWSDGWFPRRGMFDIKTILAGTLLVTAIAMVVAVPLGLGAAVYLAEFASGRIRRIVKPILEILASIPSVVVGFFALTWIAPRIVEQLCTTSTAFNMAAAGLGVGLLVTPLVASVSEDALRAVPLSLREAALGLGADSFATTARVILPAAASGVVASLIVGASRAIGETMVVTIAAGATGGSLFSLNACEPGQTMTAAMASLAVGSDRVGQEGAVESLFFVGILLFLITLGLNMISERFVRRVRERY
jgi:phosphate transport system permease protein